MQIKPTPIFHFSSPSFEEMFRKLIWILKRCVLFCSFLGYLEENIGDDLLTFWRITLADYRGTHQEGFVSSKKVSGSSPTTATITTMMKKRRKKCSSEKNGTKQQGIKRLIPKKTTMTIMKNLHHEDEEKMFFWEKWSEAAGAEPLIVWPPIRS